jgi:hypothetical protein
MAVSEELIASIFRVNLQARNQHEQVAQSTASNGTLLVLAAAFKW